MSNSDAELRDKFKAAHNLFHGRYNTHGEVAVKAHWTPQELENVQIEDEELFYDEILALFQAETDRLLHEVIEQLPKKKEGAAKEGTLIKTCDHQYVDPENLYKCQVYGFNSALNEVIAVLNTYLRGGKNGDSAKPQ